MNLDIDNLLERLRNAGKLTEVELNALFSKISEVFYQEGTIHPISLPVTFCGDIHGQLFDLFELFRKSGGIEENKYLFLGDYVDRGNHSLQTFCYLICLKLKYPENIYLLRGNHECRTTNQLYGFYDECMTNYGHAGIWSLCNQVFDLLPIGACIDNKIFAVHGGLSPDIKLIDQVPLIERQDDLPNQGALADLTWSDPDDIEGWAYNPRGAGWIFGTKPTEEFCLNNEVDLIVRAHQLAEEGYKWHFNKEQLVTVWSAPNYMYRIGNKASVLKVDENLNKELVVFESSSLSVDINIENSSLHYFA